MLQQQYRDFENERHQFENIAQRADAEKARIAQEREQMESEVRRIRELNL
jgi:hypothetical protein